MKNGSIVLLAVLLIALSGCGNTKTIEAQNAKTQDINAETVVNEKSFIASDGIGVSNSNKGKIKIIDTWHHYKETDEETLKRHEEAVNSFISDKIVIDIDYSKNYCINYTDFRNAHYFDEYWGYSTQVYYKDIE